MIKKLLGFSKKVIKKILRMFRLWPAETLTADHAEPKVVPDFDMHGRERPVIIKTAGVLLDELRDVKNPKIAIQIHMYFLDVIDEITAVLKTIPYPFDCFVTTDTEEKKLKIAEQFGVVCVDGVLQIDVFENRGRDVGPFLQQLSSRIGQYKYIAHLHTKKSCHTDFGDDWRRYLFKNMFDSKENVAAILEQFEKDDTLGLVVPEIYPIVRGLLHWDDTKDAVCKLLRTLGVDRELPKRPMCPVGDIFWARVEAVRPLFEKGYTQKDFQEEDGQLNYTFAHVVERVWCYLVAGRGYRYQVHVNMIADFVEKIATNYLVYAYTNDKFTDSYLQQIQSMIEQFDDYVIVVSSGLLERSDCSFLRRFQDKILSYEGPVCNITMYQYAMDKKKEEIKKYETLCVCDASWIGPFYDISAILNDLQQMKSKVVGIFYTTISQAGLVLFHLKNNSYAIIQESLRADVMVDAAYVSESRYIGEWLHTKDPVNVLAYDFIILNAPLIKAASLRQVRPQEKVLLKAFLDAQMIQ
ncbi:MAG: rhamnan synthesis F family protein [Lachnospiraceae bacterium]|nr:rhamnan synthesis F family protein [Lachnospiraceae bacterium]